MVIFDCAMAPLTFAYGKTDVFPLWLEKFLEVVSYCNTFIFITDIILGFRKAFLNTKTGRECRDPNLIAKRYLKSYFIIDLLSAIPFDYFIESQEAYSFLILFPLFKIFRLNRLKKIITYLQMDNKSRTKIRVLYLALRLIFICHWVACGLQNITQSHHIHMLASGASLEWNYQFWIPQVDMAKGVSNFYEIGKSL